MPDAAVDAFVGLLGSATDAGFPAAAVVWRDGDEDAWGRRFFHYLSEPGVRHVAFADPERVKWSLPMGSKLRGRLRAGDLVYVPGLGQDLALLVLMRVTDGHRYVGKAAALQAVEWCDGRWCEIAPPRLLMGSLYSEGYVEAQAIAEEATLELLPSGLVLQEGDVLPAVGTSGRIVSFDANDWRSPGMHVASLVARAGLDLRPLILQKLPIASDRKNAISTLLYIFDDLPPLQVMGTVRISELLGEVEVDGDVCKAETRAGLRTFGPTGRGTPDAAGS